MKNHESLQQTIRPAPTSVTAALPVPPSCRLRRNRKRPGPSMEGSPPRATGWKCAKPMEAPRASRSSFQSRGGRQAPRRLFSLGKHREMLWKWIKSLATEGQTLGDGRWGGSPPLLPLSILNQPGGPTQSIDLVQVSSLDISCHGLASLPSRL